MTVILYMCTSDVMDIIGHMCNGLAVDDQFLTEKQKRSVYFLFYQTDGTLYNLLLHVPIYRKW